MAVASDLPALENQAEYAAAENSVLMAEGGEEVASLTGNQNRILIEESEVSPTIKNAVIAIEDRRFYEHEGVDYLGIARAFAQDVINRSAVQGGSTITQQFVKNALAAQDDRTVFQKLRESALAYHLERQWSKQKILTQYLNTVYFGNGAYGVESAMRTYFGGDRDYDAEERVATSIEPHEAALLAGMISSPFGLRPGPEPPGGAGPPRPRAPDHARPGRDHRGGVRDAVEQPIPKEREINPPELDSSIPYFSTWVTQQLVDRYGAGKVFGGGLEVTTTVDPDLQQSAEEAVDAKLAGVGPAASVVAIENRTGEVKAMVGGADFNEGAFNLATNGHRQPGSAIKPFTLVTALEQGVSPGDTFVSEPKSIPIPGEEPGEFVAENYEDSYTVHHLADRCHDQLRQLDLRRAGRAGGNGGDRPDGVRHGDRDGALDEPLDDAGRARAGSHSARDGVRVLDDRQRRRAPVRGPGGDRDGPGGHREGRGPPGRR